MVTDPTQNRGESPETRLALMAQAFDTLMKAWERSELKRDLWQEKTTQTIEHVSRDVAELKVGHRELREDLGQMQKNLQDQIDELKGDVKKKVGLGYFQGAWKLVLGLGSVMLLLSASLTILKALRVLP